MNYVELVKDAFWITLRNRYLWFFGLFAGAGSTANFNFNTPAGDGNLDASTINPAIIVILGLLALVLFLVFVVLVVISNGGLADSVAAIERGQERSFGSTWRAGIARFWRVLGYYILFFLIGLALVIAIAGPLGLIIAAVFAGTEAIGARVATVVLAALVAIPLLIAVFVSLSIISEFALREIVVRGERILAAIGGGFRIFRQNIGRSILAWLIQIALIIVATIALLLAGALVGVVLFLPTILLSIAEYTAAAIVTGVIAGLILLPFVIVAAAALGTFKHSYWTLAYLRIIGMEVPSSRVV